MDFFGAQEAARTRSRRLTVLFAAAVLGIILTVYLAVWFAAIGYTGAGGGIFQPGLFAAVAGGTLLLVGSGSTYRISQLRKGGSAVAGMMGGRLVPPNTDDPDERRLLNVVEEMAVASGTPVPPVYVLDGEAGMNAFAAGYSIHDAAVAVTAGTLRGLTRDELQGVIAHEFSHILNGDMRMNIRLIGLLHGILLLAIVGRGLLYGSGRSSRKGNQGALIGLALLLVGSVGVLFGKLIRAAISREREYLADAAAVQFTRNPDGIAGALKKIGAHSAGSRVKDHHAEEVSHLFFAHGLRSHWLGFLATHPPLDERIRRVDPSWDGLLIIPSPETGAPAPAADRPGRASADASPVLGFAGAGAAAAGGATAAGLLDSVGSIGGAHLEHAAALLAGLPPALREAAHEPEDAQALVLALLLGSTDDESGLDPREAATLRELAGAALADRALELARLVRAAGPSARLPLLDLALPALAALPAERRRELHALVLRVVRADGALRMFEYTLVHVLSRHLVPTGDSVAPGRAVQAFGPILEEVEMVLSGLAHAGAADAAEARDAFAAAVERLPGTIGNPRLLPPDDLGLPAMDAALGRLTRASFGIRRRLLDACAHCVAHDGRIRTSEAELLRAIAEALDCPMPLPSSSASEADAPARTLRQATPAT